MKKIFVRILAVVALTITAAVQTMAQQSFAYQAVIRDSDGNLVTSGEVGLRFTLMNGGKDYYVETQTAEPNKYGNISVMVGKGKADKGSMADVPWNTLDVTMKVEVKPAGAKEFFELGQTKINPAPYAMYAAQGGGAATVSSAAKDGEPLFQVNDRNGRPVFAVTNDGIVVYVDEQDDGKMRRSGFLVTGREATKGEPAKEYFSVTSDGTTVYTDDSDQSGKMRRSGFLVTGREATKDGSSADYLSVDGTGTTVYVDADSNGDDKMRRSGFLVTGREATKDGYQEDMFRIDGSQTTVYVDEDDSNGKMRRSGFLVTGREATKADRDQYLAVTSEKVDIKTTAFTVVERNESLGTVQSMIAVNTATTGQVQVVVNTSIAMEGEAIPVVGADAIDTYTLSVADSAWIFVTPENEFGTFLREYSDYKKLVAIYGDGQYAPVDEEMIMMTYGSESYEMPVYYIMFNSSGEPTTLAKNAAAVVFMPDESSYIIRALEPMSQTIAFGYMDPNDPDGGFVKISVQIDAKTGLPVKVPQGEFVGGMVETDGDICFGSSVKLTASPEKGKIFGGWRITPGASEMAYTVSLDKEFTFNMFYEMQGEVTPLFTDPVLYVFNDQPISADGMSSDMSTGFTENDPLNSIAKAVAMIYNVNNPVAWTIKVKGKVEYSNVYPNVISERMSGIEPITVLPIPATSIRLTGFYGVDENGVCHDSICGKGKEINDGNIAEVKGTALSINVTLGVPVTIDSLKITEGENSENAGGINILKGNVTLGPGAVVSGNKAQQNGGGVYVRSDGQLNMTGGIISGNTAGNGSGIYAAGVITMSGNSQVTDDNDVYVTAVEPAPIVITGALNADNVARITPDNYYSFNYNSDDKLPLIAFDGDAGFTDNDIAELCGKFSVTPYEDYNYYAVIAKENSNGGVDGYLQSRYPVDFVYYEYDEDTHEQKKTVCKRVLCNSGDPIGALPATINGEKVVGGVIEHWDLGLIKYDPDDSEFNTYSGVFSEIICAREKTIDVGGDGELQSLEEAINRAGWYNALTINVNGTLNGPQKIEKVYSLTLQGSDGTSAIDAGWTKQQGAEYLDEWVNSNSDAPQESALTIMAKMPVTIKDLTITGGYTPSSYGGGIFICDGANVTIAGNTIITGNRADGGGGVYVNGGTLTMTGGTISGNIACKLDTYDSRGGGVHVSKYYGSKGVFNMIGGTISDNIAPYGQGGGVYLDEECSMYMSGNAVIGNKDAEETADADNYSNMAGRGGGGICLVYFGDNSKSAKLYLGYEPGASDDPYAEVEPVEKTLTGGIYYNYDDGRGYYNNGNRSGIYCQMGEVIMASGTIAYNSGGVYVSEEGVFTMSGGTITGNGHGVYLDKFDNNYGTFKMSGEAHVAADNDVWLSEPGSNFITIAGKLTGETPAAIITPATYNATSQVLQLAKEGGSDITTVKLDTLGNRFAVTPQTTDYPGKLSNWYIDENGMLAEQFASLKGKFKVGDNKYVNFSRSNLRYKASDDLWSFADKQYYTVGTNNNKISNKYDGWIDLFGWGTSGHEYMMPYQSSTDNADYYGETDIAGTKYDWGVKIAEDYNTAEQWRTLTSEEWGYLLQTRPDATSKFGYAKIKYGDGNNDNQPGLILLPDLFTFPTGLSVGTAFTSGFPDQTPIYTVADWEKMEAAGAVFLPVAGYRDGTATRNANSTGYYWSSTLLNNNGRANYFVFGYSSQLFSPASFSTINTGASVRLVHDVQLQTTFYVDPSKTETGDGTDLYPFSTVDEASTAIAGNNLKTAYTIIVTNSAPDGMQDYISLSEDYATSVTIKGKTGDEAMKVLQPSTTVPLVFENISIASLEQESDCNLNITLGNGAKVTNNVSMPVGSTLTMDEGSEAAFVYSEQGSIVMNGGEVTGKQSSTNPNITEYVCLSSGATFTMSGSANPHEIEMGSTTSITINGALDGNNTVKLIFAGYAESTQPVLNVTYAGGSVADVVSHFTVGNAEWYIDENGYLKKRPNEIWVNPGNTVNGSGTATSPYNTISNVTDYMTSGDYTIHVVGTLESSYISDIKTEIYKLRNNSNVGVILDLSGASIETLAGDCFDNCKNLKSITIPASVTSISGSQMFRYCEGLAEINVDDGNSKYKSIDGVLYEMKDNALYKLWRYPTAKEGDSFTISDGVKEIGYSAFRDIKLLQTLTISKNVNNIHQYAFGGCKKMTTFIVDDENQNYSSEDGILYNKNKKTLVRYPTAKEGTEFTVPTYVESLYNCAFSECLKLETVNIHDGVSMESVVFQYNTIIKSVTLPSGLTTIPSSTFNGCSSLEKIVIPDGVTTIESQAFQSCSSLTEIIIPATVTVITNYAFSSINGTFVVKYRGTEEQKDQITIGTTSNEALNRATWHCNYTGD
ncbi:MAG: leucine-rich repeat protein [Salinivirgaceae bacterium]|nr:leucine-rich repeat protein [Salinivirgaceae bacterium]